MVNLLNLSFLSQREFMKSLACWLDLKYKISVKYHKAKNCDGT